MYSILKCVMAIKTFVAALMFCAMPEPTAAAERQLNAPSDMGVTNIGPGKPRKPRVTVLPLTQKECTDMGGQVTAGNSSCTNAGQYTCKTFGADGRIYENCIDNK